MHTLRNGMVASAATILAAGVEVPTDTRRTGLNNNLLVVGPSGSGKTRGVVMPNVMQLNSSYVVVDPKGALHDELAPGLADAGYDVGLLDLADPARSTLSWNPFSLCATEAELHELCMALVSPHGLSVHDPFWNESAAAALVAIVHLLLERGEVPTMRSVIAKVALAYAQSRERPPASWPRMMGGYTELDELFARTACGAPAPAGPVADLVRARLDAEAAEAALEGRGRRLEAEVMRRLGVTPQQLELYMMRKERPDDPALRSALRELRRRRRAARRARKEARRARRALEASIPPDAVTGRRVGPGPHEAYDRWVSLRSAADETWRSILVSLAPRLDCIR